MIRFQPDSFLAALARPFAMAAPNGWVYVEIIAPDFRFALWTLVLLGVLICRYVLRRRLTSVASERFQFDSCVMLLLLACWLASSGNGRYFVVGLLLIGPILIGGVFSFPVSRFLKWSIVGFIFLLQILALTINNPWKSTDTWQRVRWNDRYFDVSRDDIEVIDHTRGVYLSASTQSYSLIFPLFPRDVRWVNFSVFGGEGIPPESRYARVFSHMISPPARPRFFQENLFGQFDVANRRLTEEGVTASNAVLSLFGLKIANPQRCDLIKSNSMADFVSVRSSDSEAVLRFRRGSAGFTLCDVEAATASDAPVSDSVQQAAGKFKQIEEGCPRYFPGGQRFVATLPDGFARKYAGSDLTLIYIPSDGVYVRSLRTLAPKLLASEADLAAGSGAWTHRCRESAGRTTLPWQSEL